MKRLLSVCFLILSVFAAKGFCNEWSGYGGLCQWWDECCYNCPNTASAEFKVGYFTFANSKMRDVYSNGGVDYELAGSYSFAPCMDLYAAIGYIEAHGKSLCTHKGAKFWNVPVSIGLKPTMCLFDNLKGYFTVGPRFFFFHAHNNSNYVNKHINHNGVGFFSNIGLEFTPCEDFFIDVFYEYSYKKFRFHTRRTNVYTRNVQVGGNSFGMGFGYTF